MTQQEDPTGGPFERDVMVNQPGIAGARWWNKSLNDQDQAVTRRSAMGCLALVAGGVATLTAAGVGIAVLAEPDERFEPRAALQMQRTYGWNFSAEEAPLVFDGQQWSSFDASALDTLETDLAPTRHLAWHVPTLLQSLHAVPERRLPDNTASFTPLATALRPVGNPAMDLAFAAGGSLANLWVGRDLRALVILDLEGRLSVSMAAGMTPVFEPVFLLDNWPHPYGVVGSHLALAAAARYQPLFAQSKLQRGQFAPAVLVLDRTRLSNAGDPEDRFDNRYVARMPTAQLVAAAGYQRVLYVTGPRQLPESDDLNDALTAYAAAGIDVRALDYSVFQPYAMDGQTYYGGAPHTHQAFWEIYPWGQPTEQAVPYGSYVDPAVRNWRPAARPTMFSRGTIPTGFGQVSMAIRIADAVVLGGRFDRNGSWNRSSSSSSSWGGG